jgi:hypothetical protein
MATATSLTAETIEEMMSGWVQVSAVQESQAALLTTFEGILASQQESMTTWNEETLPALYAETEAASIALSNLSGTVIPDLQVQLDGHEENLDQLNDVIIPDLQAGLNSNYEWIANLNDVVLPELYTQLDANNVLITEFNDVTLPALQADIAANEAAIAAIDISGLESDLATNTAALNTLNTVTIPGLESDISANAGAINTLNTVTIPGLATDLDAAEASLNTLNTVTIPGLNADISANETAINNLNTTTLPGLDSRLDAAEADVATLEGKFPITGPDIAANAITANKIAADAVTANAIAAGAVTASEIAANTITANEIATGAITADEIAANAVIAAKIAADAVTAGKIAADAITAREIQADAITASEIAANAVTATEIAAGAVIAGKIAADAVTANEIAANAVTATEIAAGAVIAGKIAADAVTATEIAANAVTATEIAAGAVIAGKIAADAVTATTIAAGAITSTKIAADAVTAAHIAAGVITASELAADSVTAVQIATDAVTANEIQAGAVTASEIAAHTITALQIAADTITANEVAAGAITATEIATDAVTAIKIKAGEITGVKIAADTIAVTKLIISDLENLAVDGDLADPTSATWFQMGAGNISRVKPAGEVAYLENTNTFSAQYIYFRNENLFEVKQGDEFYVSFEAMTPATNTVNVDVNPYLAVFDKDGGSQLWRGTEEGPVTLPTNTAWTKVEGTVRITETGLATAQFNPYGNVGTGVTAGTQKLRIRSIQVRRKNSGKVIVDGTIEGKHIKAGSITADEIDTGTLTGDLLAGEVIFGGLIRAGDMLGGVITGGYSEMGARGIYTVDDAGEPVFFAPTSATDGAYLKAHVDLLSADVRDNFTMHGTNNMIAVESELTLSAGVEAPSVPPVLQQVWDQVQFNKTTAVPPHTPGAGYNLGTFAFNPAQVTSIAYDMTWNNYTVIQQKSNGFRIWRFNGDGSIQNNMATGRPWVDDWNDRQHAMTCWNDDKNGLATIFLQGDQWFIWEPSYINKIPNSWIRRPDEGAVITYDTIANQYVLVQNNGGTIETRRFTVNSGANFPNATSVSTNNFEAGSSVAPRLHGAVFGSQNGLANSWTVSADTYQTVYTFTGSGVAQDDEGTYRNWLKPGPALAFSHNGTSFVSLDSAGLLTFYTNWTWLQKDAAVWIGASAADTDPAGNTANPHVGQAAGTHETPVGTMKSITLYRRSKLRITMPETNDSGAADDPDKWRLYWKRGTNVAPTDKTLLKLIGDIGSPTAPTSITISADATGDNPPGGIKGQPTAYNNFPGADPGRIESAGLLAADSLPILQMLGSGAGRWGDLTVDTTGKAVIGGDTGWINVTYTSPWTNYGAPYGNVAYRKIGNRVHMKGLAKGTGATAGAMLTLPVGFRPPTDVILAAVMYGLSDSFAATGDNPAAFTTGTTNTHTHSANPPAMDVNTTVTFTNVTGRITINATTGVITMGTTQAAVGTNWVSFEGVSFLVD